tara:strand:- start:32 stop:505 length:474 start_codon:yes stop_codon:yes gene_type:complete
MTATVYRGTIFGDETNHINNFYTNNTGGNVRIVWYYFHLGSSQRFRFYVGSSTPPSPASLGLSTTLPIDYTYYGDATTIRFANFGQGSFRTGKHYGIANDNPGGATGGSSSGDFSTELMLAAGDKMSLFVPEDIEEPVGNSYYHFALRYNFLEIPEV